MQKPLVEEAHCTLYFTAQCHIPPNGRHISPKAEEEDDGNAEADDGHTTPNVRDNP